MKWVDDNLCFQKCVAALHEIIPGVLGTVPGSLMTSLSLSAAGDRGAGGGEVRPAEGDRGATEGKGEVGVHVGGPRPRVQGQPRGAPVAPDHRATAHAWW